MIKFCGGYINPAKVEGIMPCSRPGSFAMAMTGGSIVMFECYSMGTLEAELKRVGLLPEKTEEGAAE